MSLPAPYEDHGAQRDLAYEQRCAEHLAALTPAQLADYQARGLLHEVRRHGRKTGEYRLADTGRDVADDTCRDDDAGVLFANSTAMSAPETATVSADKLADLLAEKFDLTEGQAEGLVDWHRASVRAEVAAETGAVLQRVIGFFLLADNARMCAHALAHAARMARLTGFSSLRKSALAIGVTVEGLRKVAWKWVALLNLPPLEGAKSSEAKAAYSEVQTNGHWRKKLCTPANLKVLNGKHPNPPPA